MPHNFVIPEQVLSTALTLLRDDLMIAATMNRDFEDNFGGGKGTVVNVRIPATLKARRRALSEAGTQITTDSLSENTVPVTLTDMIYSAVDITDEDLSLSIEDFTRQVTMPQVTALVEDIEDTAVARLQSVAETLTIPYDAANPVPTFTKARKMLRDLGLPARGMWAAVGTGVYAELLDAKAITDASESGSTEALRSANVGNVRGFNTVECNRLADGEIVFYGRDSFTLAIRAPRVPDGVAFGSTRSEAGFAMRWIKDYDKDILSDRSIFSTFIGCQKIDLPRMNPTTKAVEMVTPAIRVLTSTTPA
ncbi:P22 phage major capsid protein family protein [Micromonospora sp. NPDC023956]|uniref:P22 phage major capsid protein family protein n=1 Tax=Micromonospora sp. NPDC023956 TaxID=3155722 RepID=UPI0033D41EE9